jgi:hypothetical protein
MNKTIALKRTLQLGSLVGLWWATAGSGGGCGCGSSNGTPQGVLPPFDAVWCSITATECLPTGIVQACLTGPPPEGTACSLPCTHPCTRQNTGCDQVLCTTASGASCNGDLTTCDPSTCTMPMIANGALQGDLQCFDHTKTTAANACAQMCSATTDNPDGTGSTAPTGESGARLDPIMFPAQLRTGATTLVSGGGMIGSCTSIINMSPMHTLPGGTLRAYNASDSTGPYLANGCVDPGPDNPGVSPTGTNVVLLGGSGTFMSAGNGVSPQNTTIQGGYFNITASPTCNPEVTPCNSGVNAMELDFADFNVNVSGQGSHSVSGLTLELDLPFSLAPGEVVPGNAAFPDPEYMFTIPQGVMFDSIGTLDGTYQGLTTASDQATTGMIDLVTGQVTFDYEIGELVNGIEASLTGAAFTTQLVDVAPVVSAPATVTVDATTSCSASVTLAPTATSLVGLPVTFLFSVDDQFVSSGTTATVTEPIGTHTVSIVGVDTLGEQGSATETVTINDETAPAFSNVPGPETVQGCTNSGSGPVPVAAPTAQDVCSGAAATVSGSVIQFNGAATSIPVVNGTVSVPSGSGTLQFVATNANGVTSTVDVPLTVLAPPTFYGTQGVTVDDGDTSDGVNGTIYSGAGGQVLLQDDAQVGSVFSLSPVVLQDRVVSPSIDTNAGITFGHSDVIASTSTATPTLPAFPTAPVTFTGTTAITVNPSTEKGDVVTLAPGQYGAVTVYSRGQLILSAGNYEFSSLDLEPQGQLVVPSATSETAHVFVENTVIYRGSTNVATTSSSPPPAPLFLVYTGTATLTIGSPFTGTILAPNAPLSLQSLNGQGVYTGEFFAQQITLSPHTTVNSNPFTCIP